MSKGRITSHGRLWLELHKKIIQSWQWACPLQALCQSIKTEEVIYETKFEILDNYPSNKPAKHPYGYSTGYNIHILFAVV